MFDVARVLVGIFFFRECYTPALLREKAARRTASNAPPSKRKFVPDKVLIRTSEPG